MMKFQISVSINKFLLRQPCPWLYILSLVAFHTDAVGVSSSDGTHVAHEAFKYLQFGPLQKKSADPWRGEYAVYLEVREALRTSM